MALPQQKPASLTRISQRDRERDERRFPCDDGVPMENLHHDLNRPYLRSSLDLWLRQRNRVAFMAGNNFVYYDATDPNHNIGPDFYVILDVEHDPRRDCWRAWHEGGRLPDVVIEMVSKSSAHKDWVINKAICQDVLRTPNYIVLDDRPLKRPRHPLLSAFRLVDGEYREEPVTAEGRVYCSVLDLYLGMHEGWLRWFDAEGNLLPTEAEAQTRRADEQTRRADEQTRRADEQTRRADEQARRAEAAEAELRRLRQQMGLQ
jgi:Uma2 family endonuclease